LSNQDSEFWTPNQIRKLGFLPADRRSKRWFGYAELLRHTDDAAWDPRSIWARVHADLRRDFAFAVAVADNPAREGGTIGIGAPASPVGQWQAVRDRLDVLVVAADGLEHLLETRGDAPEAVFHDYLREHPILLDVYGRAESEPRLQYPEGETSPIGKTYVEPDFILRYLNNTHKLIELERPDHILNTKVGHPRVDVTHGAFQTAEWRDFIGRFYHLISSRYPGIHAGYTTALIIGRETSIAAATSVDPNNYMALLRQTYTVDEVLTYDDLVKRARVAVAQLAGSADATA
jgi:hypothetical protein